MPQKLSRSPQRMSVETSPESLELESPSFWHELVDALPDAVVVKDAERRYRAANAAALALFGGVSAEALFGLRDEDLFDALEAEDCERTDTAVLETGEAVEYVETRTSSDGTKRTLSVAKSLLRTGADTRWLLCRLRDVTRERENEEALRRNASELERRVDERTQSLRDVQQSLLRKERLAVLGQLAGGLAHQIRNPLAAINNAGAVLKRKLADTTDPDIEQSLAVIREEVWEANRIIGELLDYTRIRPPTLSTVALAEIVEHAVAKVRLGDRISVSLDLEPGLCASVDEKQMSDALAGVIRNAVEAMAGQGALLIEARGDETWVNIAVQDTGPGLTRASVTYLFEPLVTSKPLGLGLGLAIAKALVENQGGRIRLATNAGGGARFEISVRRATD